MGLSRTSADLRPPASPVPGEDPAVLERARSLQRAAECGRIQPLMRGKHLGLLCDDGTGPAALLFQQAAAELGAQVAHIGMSLSAHSPAQEVAHTARMLGRLYDAVECQGMDGVLVKQIGELSGIPVYDGLANDDARLARLASWLGPESDAAQNRRYALQALLLHTIG